MTLSQEEQDFLAGVGQAIAQGESTLFWQLLQQRMNEKLELAQTSIDNCLSADPKVTHALHLRRHALKSVMDDLKEYVKETSDKYRQLITLAAQREEQEREPLYEHSNTGTDD